MHSKLTAAAAAAAFAALAASLLASSSALAQAPACDPASAPVATFSGLPAELVVGRDHRFTVEETNEGLGWPTSDFTMAMTHAGEVFWSGVVSQWDDAELYVRADPGDGPITVSATYTEFRMDASPGQAMECHRVLSHTMGNVPGVRMPRSRVWAKFEEAHFVLRGVGQCEARYAPSPVILSVKPRNRSRWTRVGASDQCLGWDRSASGSQFSLAVDPVGIDDFKHLTFVPRTPRRDSVKLFNFRLSRARVAGEQLVAAGTIRKGLIRVRTEHYPRERVYGFIDGEINDRYWNFCVNKGKQTWMHNGNPYCIDPAFTYRTVSLRR